MLTVRSRVRSLTEKVFRVEAAPGVLALAEMPSAHVLEQN